MRLAPLTALLAALLLVLAACDDGGGTGAAPEERLANAQQATRDAESARVEMTISFEGAEGDAMAGQQMTGEGVISFAGERGQLSLTMPELAAEGIDAIETRFVDGLVYTQLPMGPGGDEVLWVRIDPEEQGAAGDATTTDPSANLGMLQGVEDVEEVGEEEIRGEPTTHYALTIDLEAARDQVDDEQQRAAIERAMRDLDSATMPMEVWLDGDDRVRRQRQEVDLADVQAAQPGQAPMSGTVVTVVEFYDFGVDVDVEAPPEDEVVGMDELMQQPGMEPGMEPDPGAEPDALQEDLQDLEDADGEPIDPPEGEPVPPAEEEPDV
jgi:hypothetical protein